MMKRKLSAASLLAALSVAAAAQEAPADLIFKTGVVFLGPGRYAQAVATRGNRIVAIGADAEVLRLKGERTRVIDLDGRAVTPGFHDSHTHFVKGSLSLTYADLNGAGTIDEIQSRLRDYAKTHPDAAWILGRGWSQADLPEERLPTKADLDAAFPSRPVALADADGRRLWLNGEALRLSGVSRSSKSERGEIVRDAQGEPTGILVDEATQWAERTIPRPNRAATLNALRSGLELARRSGITSIDLLPGPGEASPEEQFELWKQLQRSREVTARFMLFGLLENPRGFAKLRAKAVEFPRTRLSFIGVKGFVDGSLNARNASLLKPYFDAPEVKGQPKLSARSLASAVKAAHALGFQASLHAAGDRAVRMALDACAASQKSAQSTGLVLPTYPCRIEHSELIDPADLGRFADLRSAASIQPSHLIFRDELQNYLPNRLGDRAQNAFSARSLEDHDALLIFGSDWPFRPLRPGLALYAAVTRRHLNGKPERGWIAAQRITIDSAVAHYTADPARAAGIGDELGEIRIGRLADLAVFDRDLFSIPAAELLDLSVDYTIFDGKIVFER